MHWYIFDAAQPIGPLTTEALVQQLKSIAARTQVNKAGTQVWLPAAQWPELAPLLGQAGHDQELARLQSAIALRQGEAHGLQMKIAELRDSAAQWQNHIDALRKQAEPLDEQAELQSFGFYRPHYDLGSSTEYSERLKQVREKQKALMKANKAAQFPDNFHVDGSYVEGRKMVKKQVGLMLRAFNGESDAAVAQVKYNNVVVLEKRINKAFTAINTLGESLRIRMTDAYLALKLEELRLVHEYREKVQLEREEQAAIKARMREEQKAGKELQKAQEQAEKEEAQRQQALEHARRELEEATAQQQAELEEARRRLDAATEQERDKLEQARRELEERTGQQHEKLEGLVHRLENELTEALDRKAKAIARAQLTKSGHVYVISNIGSFGDDCYKIGLTRRLDPLDRVKELGDASVPFAFDVHAIIYSDDAPALEAALHRQFAARRVNKVNARKEFFRVTLDEVRQAVAKHFGIVTFVTVPEAEEYRKTLAMDEERGLDAEAG